MKKIINGKIVLPNQILEGYELIIKDSEIYDIIPEGKFNDGCKEIIDAKGGYVTPGFIDIHSDYIEHLAAPRPTTLMDFTIAIREAERELVSHGITTMYHSLSLCKTLLADHKAVREMKNVKKLTDTIQKVNCKHRLIHHRFHARFEIDNIENVDILKQYIQEGRVDLISFMDHTPGQGQYRDIEGYKQLLKKYDKNITTAAAEEIVKKHQEAPKLDDAECKKLADSAHERHIAVASHDDHTIEKLERVRNFGTTISEFPITMEVAKHAHERGMYTVAGAPNVLLGGSHSGNLSAHEAIEAGYIDILCSDYYPAGMLHAVFKLAKDFGHPLEEMVQLVTLNPAKAVNIADKRGSIEVGKKADILIVETLEDDFPVVTSCLVDGVNVFNSHYR